MLLNWQFLIRGCGSDFSFLKKKEWMAMTLTQLALAAILKEKLWESLKLIWEKKKLSIDRVGALVLGITIALGTGIDLFATVGLPINIPYLGLILTGIIISRGLILFTIYLK